VLLPLYPIRYTWLLDAWRSLRVGWAWILDNVSFFPNFLSFSFLPWLMNLLAQCYTMTQ
jgi:hypothetical protein